MKIRVYTWEEAFKAVKEQDDVYYCDEAGYPTIYGLSESWKYWGKIVTTENLFTNFKGCYVDEWSVPNWLYEVLDDKVAESESNEEDMTAEEFIHGLKRMCNYYGGRCHKGEDECPLINRACVTSKSLDDDMIGIVEEWVKKHPEKTRQSKFMKQFPHAKMWEYGDFIDICPKHLNELYLCGSKRGQTCYECCREYWGEVIE